MTDFNKGDFTQQGVDGHVNAKLRLNAKRYLDIDLTSNEQASGCTISGHVYDSLNDITYQIGSAPSGNIEITENTAEGEPLDISQYATATVNVSGGLNVPTLKINITNSENSVNAAQISADGGVSGVIAGLGGLILNETVFCYASDNVPTGTIPVGDTYSLTIYYDDSGYAGIGISADNPPTLVYTVDSYTNIQYDEDAQGWYVVDITEDAEINITVVDTAIA